MRKNDGCKISIIIPTYNRAEILSNTIRSYIVQDGLCELIVVDDASIDYTGTVISRLKKKDKRIIYIKNRKKRGLPSSRNIGINHANGDFIFFGEDDLFLPECTTLKSLMEICIKYQAQIAGPRLIVLMDGKSEEQAIEDADKIDSPLIDKYLLAGNFAYRTTNVCEVPFLHSCALFHRSVFSKIRYNTMYKGNYFREETDFYLRAKDKGFKIIFCPQAYVFHIKRSKKINHKSGCWPGSTLKQIFWNQRNNLWFLYRNRKLVNKYWGTSVILNELHFLLKSFKNRAIRISQFLRTSV